MLGKIILAFCIMLVWSSAGLCNAEDLRSDDWNVTFAAAALAGPGLNFGAWPGRQDGYDGQAPFDIAGKTGVFPLLSRTWQGYQAFYRSDYESPIQRGSSKTWQDIYVWYQGATPSIDHTAYFNVTPEAHQPPSYYWASLVLDYVPESCGWTGDTVFSFPICLVSTRILLPVPTTDDPYNPNNVTRMHLTVYSPIPEPSSLAALIAGVGSLGVMMRRRKR